MKNKYTATILLLILLISGIFVFFTLNKSQTKNMTTTTKKQRILPKEITVTLDKKGFSPTVATIRVGSAVRWKNGSGDKQTVNSDDYPTNQLHRELNFGIFNTGSSVVYTFTKPGTYGYHNQLHPEQKGKVIVEK